jgi:hypothetical protein
VYMEFCGVLFGVYFYGRYHGYLERDGLWMYARDGRIGAYIGNDGNVNDACVLEFEMSSAQYCDPFKWYS